MEDKGNFKVEDFDQTVIVNRLPEMLEACLLYIKKNSKRENSKNCLSCICADCSYTCPFTIDVTAPDDPLQYCRMSMHGGSDKYPKLFIDMFGNKEKLRLI